MGWYYTPGASRRDLIRDLIREEKNEKGTARYCLKHVVRGNVLWTVWNIQKTTGESIFYIGCDLMQNGGKDGWGHKPMDESCGPHYYTCPLSFLEMVPDPKTQFSTGWRENVRAYHDKQADKRKNKTDIIKAFNDRKEGEQIQVHLVRSVIKTGIVMDIYRSRIHIIADNGGRYILPPKFIERFEVINMAGPKIISKNFIKTVGVCNSGIPHLELQSFLNWHCSGNYGNMTEGDKEQNNESLKTKGFIQSCYTASNGAVVWLITDPGWETTTILLPEEY